MRFRTTPKSFTTGRHAIDQIINAQVTVSSARIDNAIGGKLQDSSIGVLEIPGQSSLVRQVCEQAKNIKDETDEFLSEIFERRL